MARHTSDKRDVVLPKPTEVREFYCVVPLFRKFVRLLVDRATLRAWNPPEDAKLDVYLVKQAPKRSVVTKKCYMPLKGF